MTPLRAVFFDVGDTLIESPKVEPGRSLVEQLGLADEDARTITALVLREVFPSPQALGQRLQRELGLAADPTPAVVAIWNTHLNEPVEMRGATTCVAAVRAAGARVGLIANLWTPGAEGFRRACPAIAPLVDSWHLSSEIGMAKPSAAIFHAGLQALGVRPADALMVGNSVRDDVEPALALGMSAVWLCPDPGPSGAVAIDPHAAPVPVPAAVVPEAALVAKDLSEVRRIALTWLWAKRGTRANLTGPLAV